MTDVQDKLRALMERHGAPATLRGMHWSAAGAVLGRRAWLVATREDVATATVSVTCRAKPGYMDEPLKLRPSLDDIRPAGIGLELAWHPHPSDHGALVARDVLLEQHSPVKPYRYVWGVTNEDGDLVARLSTRTSMMGYVNAQERLPPLAEAGGPSWDRVTAWLFRSIEESPDLKRCDCGLPKAYDAEACPGCEAA